MEFDNYIPNILDYKKTSKDIDALSKLFKVHKGTVKRWIEKKQIPKEYTNKDQFYTTNEMASHCFHIFKRECKKLNISLNKYTFLEPSAGTGNFYKIFPRNKLGLDIDPKCKGIKKKNYLTWKPKDKNKYVILGNPPFGLRGNMALKFINHSFPFVDVIGFILPQLFESDGKGSPMKRIKGYQLAYSEKLKDSKFKDANNQNININVIFQVWTKINTHKIKKIPDKNCDTYVKIYSLSNGGTPSSTRNKKMLNKCDAYLPSTCFDGMKFYKSFKDLPNKRGYGIVIKRNKNKIKSLLKNWNWEKESFKSTNSALNLRTSIIKNVLIKNGFQDIDQKFQNHKKII